MRFTCQGASVFINLEQILQVIVFREETTEVHLLVLRLKAESNKQLLGPLGEVDKEYYSIH